MFEAVDELVNGDRLFVGVNDKTDCVARDPEGQTLLVTATTTHTPLPLLLASVSAFACHCYHNSHTASVSVVACRSSHVVLLCRWLQSTSVVLQHVSSL